MHVIKTQVMKLNQHDKLSCITHSKFTAISNRFNLEMNALISNVRKQKSCNYALSYSGN